MPPQNRQANQAGFYGNGEIWSVGGLNGATFVFTNEVWHRNNGGGCASPTPTANSNGNSDSNRYADGNLYAYSNGNADSNGDAYCYCGAEVYADAKAASHAISTPISSSA